MTFADETAVAVSVQYERVHVTGPDAESFSYILAHRSSPNTEGMCCFLFSLSLYTHIHTLTHPFHPLTLDLPYTVCRGRQVDAIEEKSSAEEYDKKNKKK